MRPMPQDPLEGCVLSFPTRWPGTWRLEFCPTQEQFDRLRAIPGVGSHENKKKPSEDGWYVPKSLLDMGKLPANLEDFAADPNTCTPSGLKLHDYELRAITFLRLVTAEREGAILAADPGLGKTICALQALWLDGYLTSPGIVIGPNIAKGVWCDDDADARQYYGLEVVPLEGIKNIDPSVLSRHKAFFCHYELLHAWQAWIFSILQPKWLIIDESHWVCHLGARRTGAARGVAMCSSLDRRYALTGTPIPNERLELWSQLAIVQPRQWGTTYFDFGRRYCAGRLGTQEEGGHWDFSGESNDFELRARLSGTFLRFTTAEVKNELPPMQRHVIEVTCEDENLLAEYSLAQMDISRYLQTKQAIPKEVPSIRLGNIVIKLTANDRKPGAARLVCLSTLIGLLSKMKQPSCLRAVEQIMTEHNRLVVFTWRVATAEWIHEQLQWILMGGGTVGGKRPLLFGPVHGEMEMPIRKSLAKEFAKADCGIYVATIGSAGTSINSLSAASAGLIVDLHWNTTKLHQVEKRLHRDGATASRIDIFYLVARNTVDDLFLETLRAKAERIAAVTPKDTSGISLVRDLSAADAGGGEIDFDLFCRRLMDNN